MPNQYTRVSLHLEIANSENTSHLNSQYTKALMEILKTRLPKEPQLIDEIIKKVKTEL